METRKALHLIVDDLSENDLPTAMRILKALWATSDPVERALLSAAIDDEVDDDDFDGGLTEAKQEAKEGKFVSHEEVKRQLGLT